MLTADTKLKEEFKDSYLLVSRAMEALQSRSDTKWEGYHGSGLQKVLIENQKPIEDLVDKIEPVKLDVDKAFNETGLQDFLKEWNKNKGTP
jgi:ribosomal protein L32E